MKIAFISCHASPVSLPGGIDSGGQNVYVAELAKQLSELGCEVDIFTRKDRQDQADVVEWFPGIRIIHVKAGPPKAIAKERLLPFMEEFSKGVLAFIKKNESQYALIHAHFFYVRMGSL